MAKDKNSFVLYTDLIHTVEHLSNEQAGQLFKTVLQYVNDQNPEPEDIILKIAFEPIKRALKRDLKKYEKYVEKQRENGKKGGRPKKPKETQKTQAFFPKPKKADSVSVSDTVINNPLTPLRGQEVERFLEIWNRVRAARTGKPSHANRIRQDLKPQVKEILTTYTTDQIENALKALFGQKVYPKGITTITSSPGHFITEFERYLQAYEDRNKNLYGQQTN